MAYGASLAGFGVCEKKLPVETVASIGRRLRRLAFVCLRGPTRQQYLMVLGNLLSWFQLVTLPDWSGSSWVADCVTSWVADCVERAALQGKTPNRRFQTSGCDMGFTHIGAPLYRVFPQCANQLQLGSKEAGHRPRPARGGRSCQTHVRAPPGGVLVPLMFEGYLCRQRSWRWLPSEICSTALTRLSCTKLGVTLGGAAHDKDVTGSQRWTSAKEASGRCLRQSNASRNTLLFAFQRTSENSCSWTSLQPNTTPAKTKRSTLATTGVVSKSKAGFL